MAYTGQRLIVTDDPAPYPPLDHVKFYQAPEPSPKLPVMPWMDPLAKAIVEELNNYEHRPQPLGASILCAMYTRPSKTPGGVIIPEKVRQEDEWQGRIGLVLELGSLAFRGSLYRGDPPVSYGTWYMWRHYDHISGKFAYGKPVLDGRRIMLAYMHEMDFAGTAPIPSEIMTWETRL